MDEKLNQYQTLEKVSTGESTLPQHNGDQTAASARKATFRRRLILFTLISLVAIWQLSVAIRGNDELATGTRQREDLKAPTSADAYWNGLAEKGMRWATGCGRHHEHRLGNTDHQGHRHHDHHENDDHHHQHGKHGSHHKDDHHKHDKDGKHGKHGKHDKHGRKFITPKEAERIFLSVPTNDSVRAASRRYTSHPHLAGSGFDYITALQVKNDWEAALGLPQTGIDEHFYEAGSAESQSQVYGGMDNLTVWIDTYYPVMNTPVHAAVTLLTDPPFHAKLREDILEEDPDSIYRDEVPVFHGLSVSGDVRGQVIYVGYGRQRDFEALQDKGVDFQGKIVLAKYGGNFRGLKIKAAQEAGASGVLIFTDPGDDGEITEENGYEQYPSGPARQPSSVQRGSAQFISVYAGDPSTPGEPAYANATRQTGTNQPNIPSLPLSYEDVIPILKSLEGHGSPAEEISNDWVGGLGYYGVKYFTGPSEAEVHLVNEVDTRVMPIWNTMAVIPGHIKDEVVIVGNHRDAWVLGGGDPNSGTASQYEMVRGLGKLLKLGWTPMRTIVLASWDAEEYGLIGSTEWTEDFGPWLAKNTVAYMNLDSAVVGSNFEAQASPSLAWLLRQAAEDTRTDANQSRTIWDTRRDGGDWKKWRAGVYGQDEHDLEALVEAQSETLVKALGSGSDFTSFLQRYGIASANFEYQGGPKDSVYHYHSIYDSFTWEERFADPGFHRHTDAAKLLGLIALRLADSVVLPLNSTQYAIELKSYLAKVAHVTESQNATDLNLKPLGDAINSLIGASETLDEAKVAAMKKLRHLLPKPPHGKAGFMKRMWWRMGKLSGCRGRHEAPHHPGSGQGPQMPIGIPPKKLKEIKKVLEEIRSINKRLQSFESGFISEDGIKDREWYKHKGVAPGKWLGYGATTFPALTEALTIDHSLQEAQKEADQLTDMIYAMSKRLAGQ